MNINNQVSELSLRFQKPMSQLDWQSPESLLQKLRVHTGMRTWPSLPTRILNTNNFTTIVTIWKYCCNRKQWSTHNPLLTLCGKSKPQKYNVSKRAQHRIYYSYRPVNTSRLFPTGRLNQFKSDIKPSRGVKKYKLILQTLVHTHMFCFTTLNNTNIQV